MTSSSQLMFRDNIVPMIKGKHVLVLAVSVATGGTVKAAMEAVKYYGGEIYPSGKCIFNFDNFLFFITSIITGKPIPPPIA